MKLRYPEFYPEVTDWYFPRFKDDEFAWSKTYLKLLLELFRLDGVELAPRYADCGRLIFDPKRQDVHCGGSGCGCSAAVFAGYLLPGLRAGRSKNMLFCPTGALHSPTTALQGESIPGICHAAAMAAGR